MTDANGIIYFSSDNFTDTLDKLFIPIENEFRYLKMGGKDSSISVPAGNYKTIYGRTFELNSWQPTTTFYAPNVGLVKGTYFYEHLASGLEQRLVGYKVN